MTPDPQVINSILNYFETNIFGKALTTTKPAAVAILEELWYAARRDGRAGHPSPSRVLIAKCPKCFSSVTHKSADLFKCNKCNVYIRREIIMLQEERFEKSI